jgi:hypothetical protein
MKTPEVINRFLKENTGAGTGLADVGIHFEKETGSCRPTPACSAVLRDNHHRG